MSAAERQRQYRERIAAGVRVYRATLNEAAMDALVYDAGHETFEELIEELLDLDARIRVTRDGRGFATVLKLLRDELKESPEVTNANANP